MSDSSFTPRRGFLGGLVAGGAALLTGRLSPADAAVIAEEPWLARIRGKHRQVFDCVSANDGLGVAFAVNFVDTTRDALGLTPDDLTAVISYRHRALALTLRDEIWAKYKLGEALTITDSRTGQPALRHVYRDSVIRHPGMTYDQLFQQPGYVATACRLAMNNLASRVATGAGMSVADAQKEFADGVLPGVTIVPSGVYAVNRAQATGCTYCSGG